MSGAGDRRGGGGPILRRVVAAAALVIVPAVATGSVSLSGSQGPELPGGWIDLTASRLPLGGLGSEAAGHGAGETVWVGYDFPLRDGVVIGCDGAGGRRWSTSGDMHLYFDRGDRAAAPPRCVEPFGLFLRFGAGAVPPIVEARLTSRERASRRLEGRVLWAGSYPADESVGFLRPAVIGEARFDSAEPDVSSGRVRERLLAAVAVHDSRLAIDVVRRALADDQPVELREGAVFWAAQIAGRDGAERLLGLARDDGSLEIRKQAIFWLGQLAGDAATADLADLATNDPDTEVRQSAVFALSQSEDDEAVEALIRIVRSHENPEVVRSALFWLGHGGDPRALELFEDLLFNRRD